MVGISHRLDRVISQTTSPPPSPGRRLKLSGARLFFRALITIIGCLAIAGAARAQTDQAVYTDALVDGWQNWSWATVNLGNSQPVQSGTASISVSAGPYQALYLHHDAFDSRPYTDLVFWIHGG